ncbi:hypothetical protein [Alkalibacter rhizosphaerae]|nr:hypothetical protein [Alkalibacter rhizosphaerae]
METFDKEKLKNEELIKETVKDYLMITDADQQEAAEKMLIYNLLN